MPSICRKSGALQELVRCSLPCIAKYVFLVSQRELHYVGFIFIEISEMRLLKNSAFQLQNLNQLPRIVGRMQHKEKVLQGLLCKAVNEDKDNN